MFKNRFLLVLVIIALAAIVVLTVQEAIATSAVSQSVDLSWPPRPDYSHLNEEPLVSIPNTDYYQRHPELRASVQDAAIPVTDNSEASDYFQRHPELSAAGVATPLAESLERPGLACESPVDCR